MTRTFHRLRALRVAACVLVIAATILSSTGSPVTRHQGTTGSNSKVEGVVQPASNTPLDTFNLVDVRGMGVSSSQLFTISSLDGIVNRQSASS